MIPLRRKALHRKRLVASRRRYERACKDIAEAKGFFAKKEPQRLKRTVTFVKKSPQAK
jgi:hypothetical protein